MVAVPTIFVDTCASLFDILRCRPPGGRRPSPCFTIDYRAFPPFPHLCKGTIIAICIRVMAAKKEKRDYLQENDRASTDYEALTNAGLQRLLHKRLPSMRFMSVSNENRETVIAMLVISEKVQ